MTLARVTTWNAGDPLTATDLNAEFDNILSNPVSLISPMTGDVDWGGYVLQDAILKNTLVTFADGDATPSVVGGMSFRTANTAPTTITMFDSGVVGQRISVLINDAFTTVDFTGTNLIGHSGADWSPTTGDFLTAIFVSSKWYCSVSRVTPVSWTPAVGGTATYTAATGLALKYGNQVFIDCFLQINAIGSGSSTLITGVPYAHSAAASQRGMFSCFYGNAASSLVTVVPAIISSTLSLYSLTAAGVSLVLSNNVMGDGTIINISGSYYTTA